MRLILLKKPSWFLNNHLQKF